MLLLIVVLFLFFDALSDLKAFLKIVFFKGLKQYEKMHHVEN